MADEEKNYRAMYQARFTAERGVPRQLDSFYALKDFKAGNDEEALKIAEENTFRRVNKERGRAYQTAFLVDLVEFREVDMGSNRRELPK